MQITRQVSIELLRQSPLFAHLQPESLNQLVDVLQVLTFTSDEIIFDMGAPADGLFILCEGQVELDPAPSRHNHGLASLNRGDIFGEEALLFDDPRYYQAHATRDSIVLFLAVKDFLALCADFHGVETRLEILIESREHSFREPLSWLQKDEHVHVMTHRHPAILWGKLVLPIMIAIAVVLVFLLGQNFWDPGKPYGWFVLALGLSASIFWMIWRIIDWRNDYFIVTNKRVVWIEKIALVYESRQEAPLRTIMSVGIRRSQIGALIGFADVVVTTYVGTIRLRDLAMAETVASLIESYWKRAKSFSLHEESALMSEVLAEKLDLPEEQRETPSIADLPQDTPETKDEQHELGFFAWLFSDFIRLRFESDGAIVYRKHWFVLVEKIWLPGLLLLLGLIALAARLGGWLSLIPLMSGVIGILIFMFVIFIWIVYQYADWRDDIFKVTLEQIIDLDRKPLGKVRRRSAPLENVLSIEYERLGFWGFLFNFGTVTIVVGNMQLTFDHVYNPSEVQQDIFYRMGERLEHLRKFEIDSERERVSEWIASYHRKMRQEGGNNQNTQ